VTHVVANAPSAKKAYDYWQAAWDESNGRRAAKFSISRDGNKEALEMAKKARNKGVRGAKKGAKKELRERKSKLGVCRILQI